MTDRELLEAIEHLVECNSATVYETKAAAELRRLHAMNAELVSRLRQLCDETEQGFFSAVTRAECRLLIAKAKEQT